MSYLVGTLTDGLSRDKTRTVKIKIPKFSDAKIPKIQMKRPNLKLFCQKHANGIANSEDPDQTAPLGAV